MLRLPELGFLFLFFISACSSVPVKTNDTPNPAGIEKGKVTITPEMEETEARHAAETFDKLVKGQLSEQETAALKDACEKAPTQNVYCYSILRWDALERRIRIRNRPPKPFEAAVITPLVPRYVKNRLDNWRELRYGGIKQLLKGVDGFSLAQLRQLEKRALNEKRCPNGIAIAVAATMEDYLPDKVDIEEIAKLYERGAACTHKSQTDRENYLTRAGLLYFLKKDYKKASSLFRRSITITSSFSGRALYWLARCRESLGDKAGAKSAYDQLASKYPFTFHTLVAATSNNKDPGETFMRDQPHSARRSQKMPSLNPLIGEAEALRKYGFDSTAAVLIDWAMENANRCEPEIRLYLAALGDDRTKVIVVGDVITRYPSLVSRETLELYFPKAFYSLFEKEALDLNPFLLMSVARQESVFNPKAISPANAQGLLQIHPDTGLKLTSGVKADLLDPDTNITLGARYLTNLINQMNGKVYMALAAYNAGVEKLAMWTHRYPAEDPILFIDLISYKETRTYVAAVLRNYYWYRRIFQETDKDELRKVIDPRVARTQARAPSPSISPSVSLSPSPSPSPMPSPSHSPSPSPSVSPSPRPEAPANPPPTQELPEIPIDGPKTPGKTKG